MTRTTPSTSSSAIDDAIARLADLSPEELRGRWLALKGVALPKFMRRGLMTLAVAHALHEAAGGGLDAAACKRLDALVAGIVPAGGKPPPLPIRIKPGTRLVREWQGKVHDVTVTDAGFFWNGRRHRSLSHIARLITGTRWNGWVFFGLKGRAGSDRAGTRSSANTSPGSATGQRPAKPKTRLRVARDATPALAAPARSASPANSGPSDG